MNKLLNQFFINSDYKYFTRDLSIFWCAFIHNCFSPIDVHSCINLPALIWLYVASISCVLKYDVCTFSYQSSFVRPLNSDSRIIIPCFDPIIVFHIFYFAKEIRQFHIWSNNWTLYISLYISRKKLKEKEFIIEKDIFHIDNGTCYRVRAITWTTDEIDLVFVYNTERTSVFWIDKGFLKINFFSGSPLFSTIP